MGPLLANGCIFWHTKPKHQKNPRFCLKRFSFSKWLKGAPCKAVTINMVQNIVKNNQSTCKNFKISHSLP
jgi:hypothetical protein